MFFGIVDSWIFVIFDLVVVCWGRFLVLYLLELEEENDLWVVCFIIDGFWIGGVMKFFWNVFRLIGGDKLVVDRLEYLYVFVW